MLFTFVSLAAAVLALWFGAGKSAGPLRRWLWLGLFMAALVAGLVHRIVEPLGLAWVAAGAFAGFAFARTDVSRRQRLVAAIALVLLGAGLMSHRLPGFNNPRVLAGVRLGADALPYSLHLNFDKTVLGLFLLGFCHARLSRAADWRALFRAAAPIAGATIVVVMVLSLAFGYVCFDPKLPEFAGLWLAVNLLSTCVAEEAFFRGFVQAGLAAAWRGHPAGRWLALAVAALLFGVVHFAGGPRYIALATLAGAGYGWAYQRAGGRIEASILTHFALNTLHFFGFTYPALASAPI